MISYKELMDDQENVRRKLTEIMRSGPYTFADLAQKIGVSVHTLLRFLSKGKNARFGTLSLIYEFCNKHVSS